MDWPLARQLRAYDKYAEEAFDLMVADLIADKPAIIAEGKARLGGLGFDQYQDKSWRLTKRQRRNERRAEHSDALVYTVMDLATEGER